MSWSSSSSSSSSSSNSSIVVQYRTLGKLVNFTRWTDNYRFPLLKLALSGQMYPWSVWSSSRCGIRATHTACSRACCLGWIRNIQTLHSTSERQVRIEMIYIIHKPWSVRGLYKHVVSLRQLWVCFKKRQLAVRYYCSVATRDSQFCTRKNHSCWRSV